MNPPTRTGCTLVRGAAGRGPGGRAGPSRMRREGPGKEEFPSSTAGWVQLKNLVDRTPGAAYLVARCGEPDTTQRLAGKGWEAIPHGAGKIGLTGAPRALI